MKKYVLKRLLSLIPTIFIVSVVIFLLVHLTPGDPAAAMLGEDATAAEIAALHTQLGLDDPLVVQYFRWVGNCLRLDFGTSTAVVGKPVSEMIASHFQPTILLAIYSQLITILIAIPCGMLAAKKRGTIADYFVSVLSMLGISLPSFLMGLGMVLLFAVNLRVLPAAGYKNPFTDGFLPFLRYMTLPAVSLGFIHAGYMMRMTKASMLEVLGSDYIKMARSKGVREWKIVTKHTFRNALLTVITVVGQGFISALAGAAVVERSAQNRESLRQLRRRLVREQRAVSIRKFFRNKLSVVGMVLVLLMLICAVFAPLITGLLGVDPYTATMQERFQAPSAAHLFGTDNLGRDIFARVLYGAQISMTVGFTVGLLSALIGTALGLYASVNKVLDNVLMRLCDGLKAIPNILLAITLMAVLGANMKNVIISLTIVSIPGVARIARSQALLAREQTYAEAMTAVGASRTRILWRHILPNILSPIIVQMTFTFATAIISEASLSFLGAGIPSPYPSWGGMLNEARGYVYMGWWMIVFPAIFTALSVLGFNLFGDGLRDLIDPLSGR